MIPCIKLGTVFHKRTQEGIMASSSKGQQQVEAGVDTMLFKMCNRS